MRLSDVILAASLSCFSLAGFAASKPNLSTLVEASWEAYEKGDYTAAANGFKRLAEDGVVKAQTNLGYMFAAGKGVETNLTQSAYWLRRAAEQGHVGAQAALGLYYYNGEGVPKDVVTAHAWFTLAASHGDGRAGDYQTLAEKSMSPTQLEAAHDLAKKLYREYGTKKNLW